MSSKTYYKAVRPDGTDFATGTTRPVIGEWMQPIEGELEICARGYHVSTEPAETLVGGSWPCRLFEVEAKGISRQREGKHKRVCRTYRPIRELPAWMALGPNGEAVAALIEQCRALTPGQVLQLAAARAAARAATRAATRAAVWAAARDAAWAAARGAAWDAAWAAALAAAGALVVRDLITSEQFALLYGPWASVGLLDHWSEEHGGILEAHEVGLYQRARADARFWSRVQMTPACWLWKGACCRGYGQFRAADGKVVRAHRYAYEVIKGPIPDGMQLDHLCRVRSCVNPSHLQPVTGAENARRGGAHRRAWKEGDICPAGHPLIGENLLERHGPCRTCRNDRAREKYTPKRARQGSRKFFFEQSMSISSHDTPISQQPQVTANGASRTPVLVSP